MKSLTIRNRDVDRYIDRSPRPKFGYVQFFTDGDETFIDAPMMQPRINATDLRRIVSWCTRRLQELKSKKRHF